MSILWLASVSTRQEFSAVRLGPYEERIRQLLLVEQPGRFNEYGCLISYPPDMSTHDLFRQTIMPADMIIADGHHLFRFLVGGLFWVFFVSNRMTKLKAEHISLSEQGQLRIYNGGPYLMQYLRQFAQGISANSQIETMARRLNA